MGKRARPVVGVEAAAENNPSWADRRRGREDTGEEEDSAAWDGNKREVGRHGVGLLEDNQRGARGDGHREEDGHSWGSSGSFSEPQEEGEVGTAREEARTGADEPAGPGWPQNGATWRQSRTSSRSLQPSSVPSLLPIPRGDSRCSWLPTWRAQVPGTDLLQAVSLANGEV